MANEVDFALSRLQTELQELRTEGGLSLRELAVRANYSPAALSRATAGPHRPSWAVVQSYVSALGGDVERFRTLWEAIELREAGVEAGNVEVGNAQVGRSGGAVSVGSGEAEGSADVRTVTPPPDRVSPADDIEQSPSDFAGAAVDAPSFSQRISLPSRYTVLMIAAISLVGLVAAIVALAAGLSDNGSAMAVLFRSFAACAGGISVVTLGYSVKAYISRATTIAYALGMRVDILRISDVALSCAEFMPDYRRDLASYLDTARRCRDRLITSKDFAEASLLDSAIASLLSRVDPTVSESQTNYDSLLRGVRRSAR